MTSGRRNPEKDEEIKFGRRVYAHEPKGGSSRLFPSYGGMSSRAKAEKFARGTPEAMIKIDRASIKSQKHLTDGAAGVKMCWLKDVRLCSLLSLN